MASTPAVIKQLLEQLIVSVTGITAEEDPHNFQLCRDFAIRNVKTHTYVDTNPFEVNRRLAGIEERFRIVCKDAVADALHSRLEELKSLNFKWSAEILDLILHLSWKSIDNARLSDLGKLKLPEPPKELNWADIVGDEPLEGGEIWNEFDYGPDGDISSPDAGSETEKDDDQEMAKVTQRKRKIEEEIEEPYKVPFELVTLSVDRGHLQILKGAQYWHVPERVSPEHVDSSLSLDAVSQLWLVSELHAIRETLFMLGGAPCNLYEVGRRTLAQGKDSALVWIDDHKLKKKYALRHASREGFISALRWFAERGTAINRIREFLKRKEEMPTKQSFLAALTDSLAALDQIIVRHESTYVVNGEDHVVSLLQLQQSLESELRPYLALSTIVTSLSKSTVKHSSDHLDHLFTETCLLQSIGDIKSFEFIAKIFFQCLQTYLRPIREWMEFGELSMHDTSFFVKKQASEEDDESGESNLGSLWHKQYTLLKDAQGKVMAPGFVSSAAPTILTTGKSVIFLKHLINYEPHQSVAQDSAHSQLNFDTLYPGGKIDISSLASLAPFDELFSLAFLAWTREMHHSVSAKLRDVLFTKCGLWKTLKALEHVYFGADGAQLGSLAVVIFEKLDKGPLSLVNDSAKAGAGGDRGNDNNLWNDRFVLTELVQSVFGVWDFVDAKRLGVRRVALSKKMAGGPRSVRMLAGIAIEYALPWPILNILHPGSIEVYKAVFTLLLQLRRGKYVLEKLQLKDLRGPAREGFRYRRENGGYIGKTCLQLRHKLLWFVNAVTTYVTYHVLKPRSEGMAKEIQKAGDVDEMVGIHEKFVEEVREEALLGVKLTSLHDAILNILDHSVSFSDWYTQYRAFAVLSASTSTPFRRYPNDSHDLDDDWGGGVSLFGGPAPRILTPSPPPPPPPPMSTFRSRRRRRRETGFGGGAAGAAGMVAVMASDESTSDLDSEVEVDIDLTVPDDPDDDLGKDMDSDVDMDRDDGEVATTAEVESLEAAYGRFRKELERIAEGVEVELGLLRNALRGVSRAGVMPHLEV
ncbi:Spc98 family-domain-containing protein [Kalaharituber pfeilii]|nr:Spc98 family-domain-containing protein [Kalaharituber pfeilii]